jgi:hypothetical protein
MTEESGGAGTSPTILVSGSAGRGGLQVLEPGLWRCRLLERLVYLVSRRDLAVNEDSVPLHLVAQESPATELAVGRLVVEQPRLWQWYSAWLKVLHPRAWKEIQAMVRALGRSPAVDFRSLADEFGLVNLINQIGLQRVIEEFGLKRLLEEVDAESLVSNLSPAKRREVKRLLKE